MAVLSIVVSLDATILVPALPTLARELNGTAIETFWTGTSYLLSNAVFLPFIGATSEISGRRAAVIFSLVMFTAGTIVCCTANGMRQLLCGRTIQGVGGGGIFVMASIVTTDIIPLRQRPQFQGIIAAAWGLGAVLGPLCGGLFAEHTTWRWLFWINFPFCAIGFACVPFFQLKLVNERSWAKDLGRVDWVGGILFIAGMTTFLLGITWGGVQYSWSSFQTWLPILLGGLVVISSLVYEAFVPSEPFIRLSVFHNVSAAITFFLTLVQGLIMYAELYYLPFYLTSVKQQTPSIAGIFIMAVNIILFPASIVAGVAMTRYGSFVWVIRAGFVVMALGSGLLVYLDEHKSIVSHLFVFLVSGIGLGFLLPSLETASQAIAQSRNVTHATAMYIFMRSFGLCVGVATGGTVFSNVFLNTLQDHGVEQAKVIAANSEAFAETLKDMPASPEKAVLLSSYVSGFHGVFYLLLALAALSAVLAFFVKHYDLNQKLQSGHRVQRGEKGVETRVDSVMG
ncbi:hypothetical protein Daus18300_000365 [Diaporthe australafricana]|uniref:Major facilitator superfamily (MFS) profile domain-containing protein n=1 Tax=Diaporthe australafricana TaxID=127596 RepID=A0ABR3Y4T2_9PEZI